MPRNPPDKFARVIGTIGTVVAITGLSLGYHNYRWQQTVYQESLEERVLVRLSAAGTGTDTSNEQRVFVPHLDPNGKLGLEVTNIGLHPIYIRRVALSFCPDENCPPGPLTFYQHDPIQGKEPPRRLEPGEAAYFVLDVALSDLPLFDFKKTMWVSVGTTKKTLSQQVHGFTFSFSVGSPEASFR